MNLNNQNIQDYYNLPMEQTAPLQTLNDNNNENIQNTSNNNIGVNQNTLRVNTINTGALAPHNTTFWFYFHLPNDTRIYRVTYSELNPSENIQLLNNGINLSHIPDYQLPHHYNIQSLIQQQIQQQVQHPVVYQQNNIRQQYFDTVQRVCSNNDNACDTTSISVNGSIS
jgi:hypothetical protein